MRNNFRRVAAIFAVVVTTATALAAPATANSGYERIRVAGVGVPGGFGDNGCDDPAHAGATYTIALSGALEGCIYGTLIQEWFNEKNGRYKSNDHEVFIGSLDGRTGTWEMDETYRARFDVETGEQLSGGCKHPIIEGTGTGDFDGVKGRLRFWDDLSEGVAYYWGRVKLPK